jgi:hypothetical protein
MRLRAARRHGASGVSSASGGLWPAWLVTHTPGDGSLPSGLAEAARSIAARTPRYRPPLTHPKQQGFSGPVRQRGQASRLCIRHPPQGPWPYGPWSRATRAVFERRQVGERLHHRPEPAVLSHPGPVAMHLGGGTSRISRIGRIGLRHRIASHRPGPQAIHSAIPQGHGDA